MARVKNVEAFCNNCNGIRKMEITGDFAANENKKWAKCKKCKQTTVIDFNIEARAAKLSLDGIENNPFKVYSPAASFEIGEAIYHKNWDDYGKVISKEILSDGKHSISVEFQKSGQKKLIESLTI